MSYHHELIGEQAEIIAANNQYQMGCNGRIIDETKWTMAMECQGKMKTFMKQNVTLKLTKMGKIIKGRAIAQQPAERIKG